MGTGHDRRAEHKITDIGIDCFLRVFSIVGQGYYLDALADNLKKLS
jgi:hypothetical protein